MEPRIQASSFKYKKAKPNYPVITALIKDTKGEEMSLNNIPGLTYWWQGRKAGYIDFTNREAAIWWTVRH